MDPADLVLRTSRIVPDLVLLAQRASREASERTAAILGDRAGDLDELLVHAPAPVFGRRVSPSRERRQKIAG